MTNFFYSYDRFYESNRNLTTKHVKIVKFLGFFSDFCSKFQAFLQKFINSKFFSVFYFA